MWPQGWQRASLAPELRAACLFGALLSPSSRLDEGVPGFNALRTALADRRTLSISLYLRTGESERPLGPDRAGGDASALPPLTSATRYAYAATALCALQLEQRWAAGFDRVVWYVASDSPRLRRRFATPALAAAVCSSPAHAPPSRYHHHR